MARSNENISYKIADGTISQSLGSAFGALSIRLGSVTQIVHVKHKFSIIPGHETILIGADLLSHLGLINSRSLYIRMDDACRTILLPEAEFDHRISQASEVVNVPTLVYPDQRKPRCTGDYSDKNGTNANIIPVEPNLPRISDVLVFLSQANYISLLDLPKVFWQLKTAEKDWPKTARSIPGNSIMFKRAAFGLRNVSDVFQNVMADIFSGDEILIYIDDIIVIARCKSVSLGLPKYHFVFSRHPIKILGSVFLNKQRTIDPTRVESLLNLPRPKTIKDVRSLVGSVNFIREWLPQVSVIIAPIIRLTEKVGNNANVKPKHRAQRLQWTDMHDGLIQKIKQLIAKHMPIHLPPTENQVLISCDASEIAVGGIIWEQFEPVQDRDTHLINRRCKNNQFFCRLLSFAERMANPSEGTLCRLTHADSKWF
ncbi:hypothetical protein P9112_001698 [Eukaryota sp. TZLM1-RC]